MKHTPTVEAHPQTDEHLAGCVSCMMAHDKALPDEPVIDLSALSDEVISAEYWRRINARRTAKRTGRKKVLNPCPKCGVKFGVMELRAHTPKCDVELPRVRSKSINEARASLRANLGPHAWVSRELQNGRYIYTAGIGPKALVDESHQATTAAQAVGIALVVNAANSGNTDALESIGGAN